MVSQRAYRPRKLLRLACYVVAGTFSVLLARWSLSQSEMVGKTETKPATTEEAKPSSVRQPYLVKKGEITQTILISGELQAENLRNITVPNVQSSFQNTITYMATEGKVVKQGERILEFDDSALYSQKAEAERKLEELRLTKEKTIVDRESQRLDYLLAVETAKGNLKVAQLYAAIPKDLLPANTYSQYQLNLEKAQLTLDKANETFNNQVKSTPGQVSLAEIDRAQAEVDLKKIVGDIEKLQIDAPQEGIVVYGDNWASNRKFQVGDTGYPGITIMTLPDLSSMQVVGYVYDTEHRYLSPGMVCSLSMDAIPGKSWRGRIVSLTSVATRKSLTSQHKVFKAIIKPDTIEPTLWKPGMTVRLEIPVSLASDTVVIPREYLGLDQNGQYYVILGADPKTASLHKVQVGSFNDNQAQITSGLNAGDRIMDLNVRLQGKS
jgi:multidrug efflux pump subunit AcrA (membrane-fusion protein)